MTTLGRTTALTILACLPLTCRSASALTEQQALARVRQFLEDIGREMPAEEPGISTVAHGWRTGAVRVRYGPRLQIDISESTHHVVGFWDGQAVPRVPAATPLSEEQAVETATRYVQAAGGLPQDAVLYTVNPLPPNSEGRPAGWQVIWIRYHGPYRYLHDSLNVQVQAASGRLVGYANNFVSATPESFDAVLSQADASLKAMKSFDGGNARQADLVLVDPDWLGGRAGRPQRSVLAWHVCMSGGGDVILDACTGRVLSVGRTGGGTPISGKGGMEIHKCLQDALAIEVSDERHRFPISRIDLHKNPQPKSSVDAVHKQAVAPSHS